MSENGQRKGPDSYTLPADLVANIYQILAQVPSGNAARVYVRLENEMRRQNAKWQQGQQAQQGPKKTPISEAMEGTYWQQTQAEPVAD